MYLMAKIALKVNSKSDLPSPIFFILDYVMLLSVVES
jgi:hypothetical protein